MVQTNLFLFGSPRLEQAGQVIDISLRKALALLIYLAVTRQPHSRDTLATLLWPDSDQPRARASLRRTLHRLNKSLAEDSLLVTSETVELNPQAEMWLDIETYQQHVAACLSHSDPTAELSPECLSRLAEAAALYTDDFLAGFTLPDCPDFDEWQFFQTESLRQSLGRVLAQLAVTHQRQGDEEPAIRYTRRWLALDPLHEPAHRQLMELYDRSGQPAAALRQYQECARLFEAELGLPPSQETTTLYEAIKAKHLLAPFVKKVADKQDIEPAVSPAPPARTPAPTHACPEIHYVQSGEVHIAYQILGDGPVDLVFIGGFVAHLEQYWAEPGLAEFFQRLASFSRLILFDKRGVGLSDRVGYPPTLEHTMDDALAVMDAVGSERAVLFGVSQGGPNSALVAATYPERVSGLILYGAFAKWLRSPDHPWGLTRAQVDKSLNRFVTQWGGPVRLEYFAPSRAGDEHFRQWWAKLLRLASSPGAVKAVLEVNTEIDLRHVLPVIHVPTLVLHRTGDRIVPLESGRHMARLIPGATFVELNGDDHFWWVGDAEAVLTEMERFLKTLEQPKPSDRMLATILVSEICGSGLTDTKTDYASLLRQEIVRFRGREIESEDNRCLATFDGPSRAIQCATAISALARVRHFPIRIGLHTGECELFEGELRGVAAQIATEVMKKAGPGEVLVSSTVKDLVVGSGFAFEERGRRRLRGSTGDWTLFALRQSATRPDGD